MKIESCKECGCVIDLDSLRTKATEDYTLDDLKMGEKIENRFRWEIVSFFCPACKNPQTIEYWFLSAPDMFGGGIGTGYQ